MDSASHGLLAFAAAFAAGAINSVAGGVGGAGTARRHGRPAVRQIVIGIGLFMAVTLMFRR